MAKQQHSDLADRFPNVQRWVFGGGWIEIGEDEARHSFAKALDIGGMVWEGSRNYDTLEDALQALDDGIAVWLEENG